MKGLMIACVLETNVQEGNESHKMIIESGR